MGTWEEEIPLPCSLTKASLHREIPALLPFAVKAANTPVMLLSHRDTVFSKSSGPGLRLECM